MSDAELDAFADELTRRCRQMIRWLKMCGACFASAARRPN
jgi:hypothetical protein